MSEGEVENDDLSSVTASTDEIRKRGTYSSTDSSLENITYHQDDTDTDNGLTVDDFESSISAYGGRKWFIGWLFLLCFSPNILNGAHMMAYVFYSATPIYWCTIRELEEANWTPEQIRSVSAPSSDEPSNCQYYDWDYEELRQLGYQKALEKVTMEKKPRLRDCEKYSYHVDDGLETSFVPEWDLVCGRLALKATVQMAVCMGKLIGSLLFGITADAYGRRGALIISYLLYIISGPVIAWTHDYYVLLVARIVLGLAELGVYQTGYSTRSLYNQSYPIGIIIMAIVSYYIRDWRQLQLCISLPAFIFVIHLMIIPESPRWLYYSGRRRHAWSMMQNFLPPEKQVLVNMHKIRDKRTSSVERGTVYKKVKSDLAFLKYAELRNRLIICWAIWCFTSTSYYVLSINAHHLKIDKYLYTGLSGVAEGLSYIIVIPLLNIFGRRFTSSFLFLCSTTAFAVLMFIPFHLKTLKMVIALSGRLCIASVYCAIIVHGSELFPTIIRTTAAGSCSTWSHIGSTIAPYLVDYFVIYGWWVPNIICGTTAFTCTLLVQVLPETTGLELYNTFEDFFERMEKNPAEKLSLKHCFMFSIRPLHNSPVNRTIPKEETSI